MTLLKVQDRYLNQWVILFILQYETHSLQMHPKLLCRSVVALTPKLSEQLHAVRSVVVPCQNLPSPSPFFQPVSTYPSSHISSVAVPHLLCRRINPCCTASPPPVSSAAALTSDLVCHPHYPGAMICRQVGSFSLSIFAQSVAVLPTYLAISVVPHLICCLTTSPPLPYLSLLYRIYATMIFRRCL